jgi:hypothetical protein
MSGNPIALLVNYACHPVIFGPDSLLYSADFPGVMTRVVENTITGKVLCFFLQGGAGDINPLFAVTPLTEGPWNYPRGPGPSLVKWQPLLHSKCAPQQNPHPAYRLQKILFRSLLGGTPKNGWQPTRKRLTPLQ